MRILFIADGRSPIALNWISHFVQHGDVVHLATTFPAAPDLALASSTFLPVAFSSIKAGAPGGHGEARRSGLWSARLVGLRTTLRQWLGPLTIPAAAAQLKHLITRLQPDLVHAMRLPYEGMVAASTLENMKSAPLLVSIWGNDFTLHARSSPWMAAWTRWTMHRADAVHADCQRDIRLAQYWGFRADRPTIVLPGNGGIDLGLFTPQGGRARSSEFSGLPLADSDHDEQWVVNPRGVRAYVRNDTFFKAIPLVLARLPKTRFICLGMAGNAQAERWVKELGIARQVNLLPALPRTDLPGLFQRCMVVVSPTTHDGTPNTLLEALACGCFPVAGDLESIREWIEPGRNGLLIDPGDPQALAQAVLQGLADQTLVRQAREINLALIAERAEYGRAMAEAREFYQRLF